MSSITDLTEKWIGVAGRQYRARIGRDFDEDVKDQRLRVYCDATPSTREILDITEAGRSEKPMARLCVVVPVHDVVIIRKFHHDYILKNGEPDNGKLESLSIERSLEYCQAVGT